MKFSKFRPGGGPDVSALPATGAPEEKGAIVGPQTAEKPRNYDIDSDEEMRELNAIDRKMLLINRSFNALGMGRYQWCLFALTGFGYLLDLAFAQLFGLILSPLQQELNINDDDLGNLSSCFSAGLCAGAFLWGVAVDIIGRKWAFNLSLLVTAFFGLLLGVPSSYGAICALAALCGLGLGGNIPIDATILLEVLPNTHRYLLVVLSIFQPLGVLLCSLICWGLIPPNRCDLDLPACSTVAAGEACCTKGSNDGWRLSAYTIGALTLGLFLIRFILFNFRESPKFLLIKGKDEQAVEVMYSIAKFNKFEPAQLGLHYSDMQAIDAGFAQLASSESGGANGLAEPKVKKWYNLSHFKTLFNRKVIGLTLLIFAIYIMDYWAFSLAGSFLPYILAQKGAARSVSTYETYRNYIIQACCGIPGVILGAALVEIKWFGQKWSMAITAALMGVSLILFVVIDTQDANVALNAVEYFFQSAFNAILYGSAPMWFPTAVRGTGVGTASTLGRLFSIVSPLIGAHIIGNTGLNTVLYVAAAPMFAVALLSLLLPNIRRGKNNVY